MPSNTTKDELYDKDDLGKLGKSWVKKYKLSIEQALKMELEAADVYAHGTRDGWCCACEADIAFATAWIKDEPEYRTFLTNERHKAQLELLEELEGFGERGGHDVYCRTIGQEVVNRRLAEQQKLGGSDAR